MNSSQTLPDPPDVKIEERPMETVKILEGREPVTRTYDEEADVLYLSLGTLRAANGVDVGDGVILRYDESEKEVVGLTLIGVGARLLPELSDER